MALTQVTSAGLKDGEIVNADLHSAAQVALAKLEVIASNKIVGNDSGNAVPKELTPAEVRTIINVEDGATADQTKSDIDALGIAATTAATLATARTIAGVSFDGSANISLNNNAITNGAGYITASNAAITNKLPLAGGTLTGNLIVEDSVLRVGDFGNDNYTEIKHLLSDSYGFDYQHDNASAILNEQGTTNQALVLGDVNADGSSVLFGVSIKQVGVASDAYVPKLTLTGAGALTLTSTCTATTFSGSGASLTSLPAGQLTGTIAAARLDTATTQSAGNSSTKIATTAFVSTAVTNLIGGAPGALDTLNELAAAINDDSSYASTVTTALATKAVLTGSTNNTIATVTGSNALQGEANLTFDGTNLSLTSTDGKIILKDGNSYIQFLNTDKSFKFVNAWGAGEFIFNVNGGERLRIAADGEIQCRGAADNKGFAVYLDGTRRVSELIEHSSDGELRLYTGEATPVLRTVLTSYGNSYINASGTCNVGIGTSSPDNTLHLLYSDSQTYNTDIRNAGLQIENNNGTDNTYAQIHLRAGNSDAYLRAIREGSNLTSLAFLTDNGGSTGDAGEAMRITSGGSVGINTASPATVLDVQGAQAYADSASTLATSTSKSAFRVRGSNNSSDSLWIGVETSDANPYMQGANGVGNNAKKLLLNPFGGSVGVKTTNPRADLEVRGTILASDGNGSTIPGTFPANDVQLMVYTSTAGQPITNDNCARLLIATDATQTGAQGYHGAIDFGSSDCSAAGGASEFNWRTASVMSRGAGDTSPSIADGNLEFHTKTTSGSLTKQMEIDQSGRVQKFSQPAFLVEHANNASTTPKTKTVLINQYLRSFSHVRFNIGSHFNNSTGLFTAPVQGVYSFNVTMTMDNGGGAGHDQDDSAGCYFRVQNNSTYYNRTGGNREWHSVNPQYFTESGRELTACFATIEQLDANATCGWYFSDWDDADTRILTATLSGYLLG